MNSIELIEKAKEARRKAFAPISNYLVGAALLTSEGRVYLGSNIEDASGIGVTNCCAERCAFIKAISEGEREFSAIAVVGGFKNSLEECTPCGVCRQYMMNWNPNLKVITEDDNEIKEFILKDLLPNAWYEIVGGENEKV